MMETILLSFILVLITTWMTLGILYFCTRYVSPYDILIRRNKKCNERTKEDEAVREEDGQRGEGTEKQAEFVLIDKSRSISPIIPRAPSTSSSKNSKQNNNNFAPQNSENKDDMKEENNEMEVGYEVERKDENEVVHRELSLPVESASEDGGISSQSILAHDLGRVRRWRKNSDEVDDAEVKEIVGQLKDTDFTEEYKGYIAEMQGKQSILLDRVRRAEEGQEQTDELSTLDASRENSFDNMMTETDNMGKRSLLYYL